MITNDVQFVKVAFAPTLDSPRQPKIVGCLCLHIGLPRLSFDIFRHSSFKAPRSLDSDSQHKGSIANFKASWAVGFRFRSQTSTDLSFLSTADFNAIMTLDADLAQPRNKIWRKYYIYCIVFTSLVFTFLIFSPALGWCSTSRIASNLLLRH